MSIKKIIQDYIENTPDFSPLNLKYLNKGFFQIIRKNSDWEKIRFHFEIQFTAPIEDAEKIDILVHLEGWKVEDSRIFNQNTLPFFQSYINCQKMNDRKYYELFRQSIDVNFKSETETRNSLDKIVEILRNDEFKDLGNLADEYVKQYIHWCPSRS